MGNTSRIEELVESGKTLSEVKESLKLDSNLSFIALKLLKKEYPQEKFSVPSTLLEGITHEVISSIKGTTLVCWVGDMLLIELNFNNKEIIWTSHNKGLFWNSCNTKFKDNA